MMAAAQLSSQPSAPPTAYLMLKKRMPRHRQKRTLTDKLEVSTGAGSWGAGRSPARSPCPTDPVEVPRCGTLLDAVGTRSGRCMSTLDKVGRRVVDPVGAETVNSVATDGRSRARREYGKPLLKVHKPPEAAPGACVTRR